MCLVGEDGTIIADERRLLKVASGLRGLRQSEALFQHVQNIPELTARLVTPLEGHDLAAIGVSVKPRPQEESYLPVFLPGQSLAQALSHMASIPCYELTHQETHIWSGIATAGGPVESEFLAIHLSGGTTELTAVKRQEEGFNLQIDLWGATSDLHAGQFVDRLGVALGLGFPCGPALERLAAETTESVPVPTFHREGIVSFSGPLTALERLVGELRPEVCARACFKSIARTLVKWISWAGTKTECRNLLVVGGVAANRLIREELNKALPGWRFYFANPAYSVDNAYGAAFFAGLASGQLSFSPGKTCGKRGG
ncbi:MAG: O-sialoglycoprotein endopeptidase [Firmicutes bacterium]|nr:O-sialoglycoprotein endopeptidase [Bacillota bacterium]